MPVQVYRSSDLKSWTIDEQLSAGIQAEAGYEMTTHSGDFWLATTKTGSSRKSVVLKRFDSAKGSWSDVKDIEIDDTRDGLLSSLWIVGLDAAASPLVVYKTSRGEIKTFR